MILWKGHCSVHGRFTPEVIDELRAKDPEINILVHPECTYEVVTKADLVGSTEFIIKTIEAAPSGSSWAIGTELNLVKRLADAHPDKNIAFLEKRSEEHTSELQSLMRLSYAAFCLNTKNPTKLP